jgi:hypothetical protein
MAALTEAQICAMNSPLSGLEKSGKNAKKSGRNSN